MKAEESTDAWHAVHKRRSLTERPCGEGTDAAMDGQAQR